MNSQIKCNVCGGYMIKKKGRYGEYYWCTNYPYCGILYRFISDSE
ncbi:topoisomerase DNA-binding C4 zinc finger domain-containing protein [Anaerocolumna sp.]